MTSASELVPPAVVRSAYQEAAHDFLTTVEPIPPDRWDGLGLGDWTLRSLVGHTSRSLLTVEAYLTAGAEQVNFADAVDYFMASLASVSDEAAITERGRQAGGALGADPVAAVRALADRVLPLVDRTPDDALVGTPWGGMRLIDYLPTRVFELTIHTLDIGHAIGTPLPASEDAFTCTWAVIGALARRRSQEIRLLRAGTGRGDLPSGFSVLRP